MNMRTATDSIIQPLSTPKSTARRRSGSVEFLRFCRCRVDSIVACSGIGELRSVSVVANSVVLYDDRTDGTDV